MKRHLFIKNIAYAFGGIYLGDLLLSCSKKDLFNENTSLFPKYSIESLYWIEDTSLVVTNPDNIWIKGVTKVYNVEGNDGSLRRKVLRVNVNKLSSVKYTINNGGTKLLAETLYNKSVLLPRHNKLVFKNYSVTHRIMTESAYNESYKKIIDVNANSL